MTDRRISMTRNARPRLPRYWDFFEAIEQARGGNAAALCAILEAEGDERSQALADLIRRKVHKGTKTGPKGDQLRKGTPRHAAETILARTMRDLAEARAAAPRGRVRNGTAQRLLAAHKERLIDEGHRNAAGVDLAALAKRLERGG
jgi:hypothetical protein